MGARCVNGILLLYHRPVVQGAPTVMEHVDAFRDGSCFRVWAVNTELGFPRRLPDLDFQIVVLHYSLFGLYPFALSERFIAYLQASRARVKIAFFQDEYRYWPQRSALIEACGISWVYTLLTPPYFADTYLSRTRATRLISTLPGYVGDDLVRLAGRLTRPDRARQVDVGYRARRIGHRWGRGAQEKHLIAEHFLRRAAGSGLRLDISPDEDQRLYGMRYYEFLANCRAVLGVEAGVSIFDIDDVVGPAYERLTARHPGLGFDEVFQALLWQYEDKIYYRTISPRHFEAAAFRVCQILFEGQYSGILRPMVHYIPLKKDFSNFDLVLQHFRDPSVRETLTENAYRDLIASGTYSYRGFMAGFDAELRAQGFEPTLSAAEIQQVDACLKQGRVLRRIGATARSLCHRPFPGRSVLRSVLRPVWQHWRHLRSGAL
jgi:hypothetical protein